MERRVLVAFVLSFLVIYGYQYYFARPKPKPAVAGPAATAAPAASDQQTAAATPSPAGTQPAAPSEPAATPLVADTAERDVRIETPLVSAVFTNRGGVLKSWTLKNYHDRNGEPLELVATELQSTQPMPFTIETDDPRVDGALRSALYTVRGAPEGPITAPTTITFEYSDSSGLSATKEFVIDPSSFLVTLRASVKLNDRTLNPAIQWGPGLGDNDSQIGRSGVLPGGIYAVNGKVSRPTAKSLGASTSYEQPFEYVGIEDHYFLSIALKTGQAKVEYSTLSEPLPPGSDATPRQFVSYALRMPQPEQPVTFFVGPKNFDTLAALDPALTKTINYGMLAVIVVPFLRTLNWIHGYIGNYGWAIVALTVLLNVILFPLNHKSVVSMRKMQEIQPEAKAIQERYSKLKATDPARQKMNQELMALYRQRGVNPASGCIPMLLTLPIFMAFYWMLSYSIELRGAPFIGWIRDLSQPDPYYVLPILVGVAQFVTQWMTPMQPGVDPAQQKIMMIMPLVLTFVFVASPAGSLLYWFVQSILRVGQQWVTNKLIGPPKLHAVRPAAERRVKRVGAGKTEGASRES